MRDDLTPVGGADGLARRVLDGMTEGFVFLDLEFRVVTINAEGLRMEQRPEAEILGRSHWEVWPGSEESDLGRLYKAAMRNGRPVELEHSYAWPDGRVTWLEMRAYPSAGGLAIFYRDVTARKRSEETLRDATRRLDAILNNTTSAVFLMDERQQCVFANPAAEALTGYSFEQMQGRPLHDVVHHKKPDGSHYPLEECPIDRAFPERAQMQGEELFVAPDGSFYPVAFTASPVLDDTGRPIGTVIEARNIAQELARQTELQETEERYRLAVRATNDAIWDWHFATNHVLWNDALYQAYGFAPEDVEPSGEWWIEHIHPDDRARVDASIHAAIDGDSLRWTDSYRFRRRDGAYAEVLDRGFIIREADGRAVRMLGAMLDLTEQRAQAVAIDEARRLLDAVVDAMPVGIIIADASGALVRSNPANLKLWGAMPEAGKIEQYARFRGWWPDSGRLIEPHEWAMARALEHGETCHGELVEIERFNDGERRFILNAGAPVRDSDGRIVAALVSQLDVTDRVRAERALQALNATLEERVAERTAERDRIWRTTPDLLGVADEAGRWISVNPAWTRTLGWGEDEIVGRTSEWLEHPDDVAATRGEVERLAAGGRTLSFENRFRHRDGDYRWLSWTASPFEGRLYCIARDVTLQKQQQAQLEAAQDALRQSQKMEAVGQLTGGIAHDFNNMLAVVIGALDLLGRQIGPDGARARRHIDSATQAARRAALLTQRLLAFSRQQPLRPQSTDVNRLVAGMSDLLRGSLGGDVVLETVLAGGLWRIHVDQNQLENAILNLAVNARDAMPEGGRVTIETQCARLDDRYASAHLGVPAGQYVMIAVTDTGSGMAPEVVAKAFDPFFTTKEVGKGTGLGLSQVYGFVKQSGGHVKIYSEPDEGTTVKIYLPRLIEAGAAPEADEQVGDLGLVEGSETVLVVEDEDAVREVTVEALRTLGYRTLEANGAEPALRLLDAHPEIGLLLTDVVMPVMNGRRLADEAMKRRPDLRVLFTTGYTHNAVVHNGVLDPGVELISKPFTVEELGVKLREMLDVPS